MNTTTKDDPIRIGTIEIRFVATSAQSAGHADIFEMTVPPRAHVPASHRHNEVDEIVYGLEGVLTYTIDGVVREVGAGQSVIVPRGATHHFANLHEGVERFLSVQTPGKFGPAYYREIGAVIAVGGPPDRAKLGEVMTRYGIEPQLRRGGRQRRERGALPPSRRAHGADCRRSVGGLGDGKVPSGRRDPSAFTAKVLATALLA